MTRIFLASQMAVIKNISIFVRALFLLNKMKIEINIKDENLNSHGMGMGNAFLMLAFF